MVGRVLRGKNPITGAVGFWVSKPGFDVRSANVMQMAFSSDYIHPKVVIQGTTTNGPISAVAPFNTPSQTSNGAQETKNVLPFGRTLASIPAAFIIATAPDWTITLANNNGGITYLQNQWHTAISETCDANTNIGDYWSGRVLRRDGLSNTGSLRLDWYAARVVAVPYTDRLEILTNCKSTVTVKYLVLENQ